MAELSLRLGKSYAGLAKCHDRFVAVEGPRGTAKTRSILTLELIDCLRWPGTRLALARSKRTALTETVLNTLEQQVFPALQMAVPGGANRENRSSYHLPNGSIIVPIGLDNPEQKQKLFSSEWTRIYVAESVECSQESIEMLGPTLRHYPEPANGEKSYVQVKIDHNPVAPGHWIYQRTEKVDPKIRKAINGVVTREQYAAMQEHNLRPAADPQNAWKRIVTKHMDNVGYWDFDAWGFIELGREYLKTLDGMQGFQRRRMLDGEPCTAEGTVFLEFDHEGRQLIDPFTVHDWPVWVLYDSGYDHPAAIIFLCIAPDGQLFIVDEIYGSAMALATIADKIKDKIAKRRYNVTRWLADPRDCFKATAHASGRTIADQMREDHGLTFERWPAAAGPAKTAQVEALRSQLRCEMPLQVFSWCANTINEFQSWSYARNTDGTQRQGDDAYEDRNNHALDAIMGAIALRPTVGQPTASLGRKAS